MKVRITIGLALIALSTSCALAGLGATSPFPSGEGASRSHKTTAASRGEAIARFEALKKLAGDWVQIGEDGKPGDTVISRIKVTSGGTAIQETVFPGQDHEMVTIYTVDSNDLMLTHYCVLGNQPRLKADSGKDVNKIAFSFVGGGNMKSDSENHMHSAVITIVDSNHFNAEWCGFADGKMNHKVETKLVRKK